MRNFRIWLCAAAWLFCAGASAQWMWIDPDGRKVFSDRAPPAETPDAKILRRPGVRPSVDGDAAKAGGAPAAGSAAPASPAPAAAPAPAPAASAPRPSGRDRDLEDRRKQAEAAEAERRKADDEKYQQLRAENCARARQSMATLDSGVRIARMNAKGEPEIIDDDARAAESRRLQGLIDRDCAP